MSCIFCIPLLNPVRPFTICVKYKSTSKNDPAIPEPYISCTRISFACSSIYNSGMVCTLNIPCDRPRISYLGNMRQFGTFDRDK